MASGKTKLTFAYGTFSCTLEGFEDPVGAASDLADRMRDLAARDPHFGAAPLPPEPPAARAPSIEAPSAPQHPAPDAAAWDDDPRDDDPPTPRRRAGDGMPAPAPSHPTVGGVRLPRTAAHDPDIERLFAATDSRLTDEDTSRRNATISHLRAAAAARRIDGAAPALARDPTAAWRDDLARVVRPSPHDRTIEGRAAPAPIDPPPLVLVSAQRVPAEATPPTFAQVAAEARLSSPADVLAAAARHLARTTGSETFERPRLLALAAEAPAGADREAALIAFGRMLRAGAFRRAGPGLYALVAAGRADERAG